MSVPWPVEMRAEQLVLELRELLVRCDENLKAWRLLDEAVPYFLDDERHPAIARARADQHEMVRHVLPGGGYQAYYRDNPGERPFEQQYGIEPAVAHEHMPRVAILRERLARIADELLATAKAAGSARQPVPWLCDLSCNDGWMAVNLAGFCVYHGIDLNPGCVERAKARQVEASAFVRGDIHDAQRLLEHVRPLGGYDAVSCFECVEHVPDPDRTLAVMTSICKPGGRLFVSTPLGAVEHGDLPNWFHVEPKGHVRVYTPRTFHELLARHGEVESLQLGPDSVMVAEVTTPIVAGDADEPVPADRAGREGAARTARGPGAAERRDR